MQYKNVRGVNDWVRCSWEACLHRGSRCLLVRGPWGLDGEEVLGSHCSLYFPVYPCLMCVGVGECWRRVGFFW